MQWKSMESSSRGSLLLLLLSAPVLVLCIPSPAAKEETVENGTIYQFKYQVHDAKTNDYKTHEEFGEDGLVYGTYTVREANGDLRIVSYTAGDEKGFQAIVRVQTTPKETPEGVLTPEPGTIKNTSSGGEDGPLKIQLNTQRRTETSTQLKYGNLEQMQTELSQHVQKKVSRKAVSRAWLSKQPSDKPHTSNKTFKQTSSNQSKSSSL